jgi:signal transduction histidine kinase
VSRIASRLPGGLARAWLLVLAVVLAAAAAASAPAYPSGPVVPAVVLSALTAGAVVLRARSCWALTWGVATGLLALTAVGIGQTPMWAFVELLLVTFWVADGLPREQALRAVGVLLVAAMAFDVRSGEGSRLSSVMSPLVIVAAPALAGALLRRSRQQAAQLQALSAELAEQRDRAAEAAELAERTRIAREIHDVVAHTVSVMLVQAGAAEDRLDSGHPAAGPVRAIRATGKEALSELRRVVGVLREPAAGTHPQPTLADLSQLVSAARVGGAEVHVDWRDDVADLPAGVQLTAFRAVQEALTNARKHAPGAPVTVRLWRDSSLLHVVVEDAGSAISSSSEPGFGLVGLAERAELYGGHLRSGPRAPEGGWRVDLELPVDTGRASEAAS